MINIKQLSEKHYEKIRDIRHEVHMYPEEGFKEYKTSNLIIHELEKLNIEVKANVAKTGVVGLIKGKYPGKTILLRADMDALRVEERAEVEYKSKIPGVMHACGHDGHVAGLLGAAMILNELKEELHGNVKLVFQPSEERDGGARIMLEEGILDNPKVDMAFAAHLWGPLKEGTVAVKSGPFMASPDIFNFTVIGRGGHGAMPQFTIDPIPILCQIINNIQTIVSRKSSPFNPIVVSCCKIQGGESHNVIPNEVLVEGTIRTLDEETRAWVPKIIEEIIKGITESNGASYEFKYEPTYPVLINDVNATKIAEKAIAKVVGNNNVIEAKEPSMGGEDFAYIAKEVPASFFFIGIAKEGEEPVIHHNPYFKWDDKNIKIVAETLSQIALDYLK